MRDVPFDRQYRSAARRLLAVSGSESIPAWQVQEHASVHQMGDGAFVDAVLWVSKEEAEAEEAGPRYLPLPDVVPVMTAEEKARVLLADIRAALVTGTKHYDISGRPLTTELQVVEALRRDGRIEIKAKEG